MAVNTTIGNQPEQVKPMATRVGKSFPQRGVARQFAFRYGLVNSRQILINDPAGSQVKMANFGVAHLALRQTDLGAAGAQFSARILLVELVVKRRSRKKRCVTVFFPFFPTTGINAPAIANNEHNGAGHMQGTLPTIAKIDKRFFLL